MTIRAFVIAVLVALVTAGASRGQTPEDAALLRITREQFDAHAAALEFTVAQRDAAETMFIEYEREFDDAWKAENELIGWLWSNTSSGSWWEGESEQALSDAVSRESHTVEEQWQRGVRALEARYFHRLTTAAIGREDTVASLSRARLRERMLTSARFHDSSGALIDLIALLAALGVEWGSDPGVQEVLREYELALDRILRARDEYVISRRGRMDRANAAVHAALASGADPAPARMERARVSVEYAITSRSLCQLHVSTAHRIARLISVERRPSFDDAIHVALHPYLKPEAGPTPEEAF